MRNKIKKAAYQKEYHKKWYANPENAIKKKKQARDSNIRILERNRLYVNNYKLTHSCKLCGESDIACLDFHHLDGENKDDNISNLVRKCCSIQRIQKEINKCEILCSNCHRKYHYYSKN